MWQMLWFERLIMLTRSQSLQFSSAYITHTLFKERTTFKSQHSLHQFTNLGKLLVTSINWGLLLDFSPLFSEVNPCFKYLFIQSLGKSPIKKERIFYGQADSIKGLTPPYGQVFCDFFWGVHLTSVYDYTWVETNFDKKNVFYPLFDLLVEWRWAFQIVADTTTESRMQPWEVH